MTSRLQLLTYLTVLPYRNPMLLAKAATTIDRLSGGRFVLGAGTGYQKTEFFAVGSDFDERNTRFDEALDVLPLHWKGEPFSYTGTGFAARDVIARPRPLRDPIPIWIGGNSKLTLRRVAERCDGWMPLTGPAELASTTRTPHLSSVESIADRLAMLRELAGERFEQLDIVVPYLGAPSAAELDSGVGERTDYFGRLAEIGVTWIVVNPPWAAYPAAIEFIEGFAALHLGR